MIKFENIKISNPDDQKSKTITQKIRNNKTLNKGLKTVAAIAAIEGGSLLINEGSNNLREYNKYVNIEKQKAESYEIKDNQFIDDTTKYLSDDFILEASLIIKDESLYISIEEKKYIQELIKDDENELKCLPEENNIDSSQRIKIKEDIEYRKSLLKEIDLNIEKVKETLTNDDIKKTKENIIKILTLVENVKLELINHIKSDEYLEKLSHEMKIPKYLAKEHVKVRMNNIKNISYSLQPYNKIQSGKEAFAYYRVGTNNITLPYDFELEDTGFLNELKKIIMHEILHESTNGINGLSDRIKNLRPQDSINREMLHKSNKNDIEGLVEELSYYADPSEIIVRKQILDLEMEELGIKKYGEKFTDEHYQKLLKLRKEGKLSSSVSELIDYIKSEKFIEIMNELAENKSDEKDFYNPDWNYKDISNV